MKLSAKEIIKLLITREGITQKELTKMLCEHTSRKYTPDGLSRKLNRGTITYNEVIEAIEILGYEIKIERKEKTE